MAVYRFSALRDGQSVSFRPTADVLSFDQSSISAADIRVSASGAHTRIEFGAKDILLLNTSPQQLATSNITFANGSRLVVGDNSTATGDNGANTLPGTSGRDHLIGMGGDDFLDGGAGADRLDGGLGNDYYVVGAGDIVVDAGGARDSVASSVSWTLAPGLEILWLTGNAVQGLGNDGYNEISGNGGNNVISGRGGDDALWGQGGNDTFNMSLGSASSYGSDYIDGGTGVDTIDYGANARSPVTIDLGANRASGGGSGGSGRVTLYNVENAVGGNYADRLVGDAGDNFLYGGAGNDTLVGGAGNDRLEGGSGNNVYLVDAPGDAVMGGSGRDVVFSSAEYYVLDGRSVEELNLTGTGDLQGIGSWGNEVIRGNSGNNTLAGGHGNDTLTGGAGADHFNFPYLFDAFARITDFTSGVDKIEIRFASIPGSYPHFEPGDARFWAAPGATRGHDADDRIIYNTSNGNLYYDPDGSGSHTSYLWATLEGAPRLVATDLMVV